MNNHFFYHLSWIVVFAMVLTACAGAAASPTATLPPPPTSTTIPPTATTEPTATATVVPTDTPQPTATAMATPDKTATAQFVATQTAEALLAEITKELDRVGIPAGEGSLGWIISEPVSIMNNTYDTTMFSEFEPAFSAANFVLHTDITWESTGGWSICGVAFRSVSDFEKGEQYRFQTIRLSGAPSWDIERWNYGDWVATASGQIITSKSIDQNNGATNSYTLVAKDGKFSVFVNDDKSKNVLDSKLKEGYFAFMNWQDTGETTCTFTNTWVWVLK